MIDLEGSIQDLRDVWGQGPGIHKRPADLARYDVLIERIRPRVVVETGLYYGGSAHFFAQRVPYIINVELNRSTTQDYINNVHGLGEPPDNNIVFEGNSLDVYDQVGEKARALAGDEPILVVLDSNHDTEIVYQEAIRYGTLVTPGSYLVIEDGILHFLPCDTSKGFEGPDQPHNWFDGDPLIGTWRFLAEYGADWIVDKELEDMFPTTTNPNGYLRRK